MIRRRKNRIMALKVEGEWCEDPKTLKQLAVSYFNNLFAEVDVIPNTSQNDFPVITDAEKRVLASTPTAMEILDAVFAMAPFKAPGPDGLQAIFYQKQWNVVGSSIIQMVTTAFERGKPPSNINSTLITLIPKMKCPERHEPLSAYKFM